MTSVRARSLVASALVALALAVAGYAAYELVTWPDVPRLAAENPETTAFIERWRQRQRAEGRPERASRPAWTPVPYARIDADLKVAVLVAEDIDFFAHDGFERRELKKAITEAWEKGEAPRGASTITQQLAKNLWLSPSRNPWRKVKEAILTRQLERHLGKRRILELYLNVVEFGPGIYGAEAAARVYYRSSAAALSPHQAAALAGSLPKPSAWHPGSKSQVYARRVARIEGRMERAAWLRGEL
jgi:monofunctional biosynthetic peptidoglycan transglycosylase